MPANLADKEGPIVAAGLAKLARTPRRIALPLNRLIPIICRLSSIEYTTGLVSFWVRFFYRAPQQRGALLIYRHIDSKPARLFQEK
jgi:hypothetical protein